MGSAIREQRLLKIMPSSFKEKCPCCGDTWTLHEIDFCEPRFSIQCKNKCFSFCRTQHFVPNQIDTAWGKLWDSFVFNFGISKAIEMTDPELYAAARLCKNISEDMLSVLMNKIDEAKKIVSSNGMVSSVYLINEADDTSKFGINFQPVAVIPGHTFHYDHGAGIHRNNDALVLWKNL